MNTGSTNNAGGSTTLAEELRAKPWIDGEFLEKAPLRESHDPADDTLLGLYHDAGTEEARVAIAVARRTFDETSWSRDRMLRAQVLDEMAAWFVAHREPLIAILSRENGKLLREAAMEVDHSVTKIRYAAALARIDFGRAADVEPGFYSTMIREPIGVAGIIVPWNSPVILLVRSLAPALAAGCTVVIKAAAQTALTTGLLFRGLSTLPSLPRGVVNGFIESESGGAQWLVRAPEVDVISYTGSTRVGRQIMASGAETLKRLNLELGGKSPALLLEDADLESAIPTIVTAGTLFAGQFCMASSRVLVHRSRYDEVRERLAAALAGRVVGPSRDPSSQMGPLIDRPNVARVDAIVRKAETYAEVIVRGGPALGHLAKGAFYRPSLVAISDVHAPIVQEEVFGPVLTLESFESEDEAVHRANATTYGLSASVFTRDIDRAARISRRLRAGTVWFNTHGVILDQFEEGGVKQSGLGRLNGFGGIEAFQECKHVLHRANFPI
ncbi:aldehyde dehydrogenase family protein [Pendulispora rubella]|uniref:Aldehyde dehydrogenase family protein n=1 Tax=Pendulispora rubella TaxID=2741070 RepID=A0ABZ2L085_9BACT